MFMVGVIQMLLLIYTLIYISNASSLTSISFTNLFNIHWLHARHILIAMNDETQHIKLFMIIT